MRGRTRIDARQPTRKGDPSPPGPLVGGMVRASRWAARLSWAAIRRHEESIDEPVSPHPPCGHKGCRKPAAEGETFRFKNAAGLPIQDGEALVLPLLGPRALALAKDRVSEVMTDPSRV